MLIKFYLVPKQKLNGVKHKSQAVCFNCTAAPFICCWRSHVFYGSIFYRQSVCFCINQGYGIILWIIEKVTSLLFRGWLEEVGGNPRSRTLFDLPNKSSHEDDSENSVKIRVLPWIDHEESNTMIHGLIGLVDAPRLNFAWEPRLSVIANRFMLQLFRFTNKIEINWMVVIVPSPFLLYNGLSWLTVGRKRD